MAGKLADLDRRIASMDDIIAGAAQRGRANTALAAMADQKKARAALVNERERESQALADLRVERGGVEARTRIDDSKAAPIMYVVSGQDLAAGRGRMPCEMRDVIAAAPGR